MIIESVLIPKKRIRIIKEGKTRSRIEKYLNVKLSFKGNSVLIKSDNGLKLFNAKNIVKAIARGFSPEKAFRLFDKEETLKVIELKGFSSKKMKVIKSRLIGTKGKTRKIIEQYSGCSVSIYGKTVSLIGKYKQIEIAGEAIEMIIKGSKHSRVYNFLEKAKP